MSESFEDACASYGNYTWIGRDGVKRAIDRLQKAHEHDMEMADKSVYHRGYEAGQRSMDAEHRAVAMRLRRLRFDDGGSHGRLSEIAHAVYPEFRYGWTQGACAELRDKLIELMGGVHDEPVSVATSGDACGDDCDSRDGEAWRVSYDVLGNERHEAVCELRYIRDYLKGDSTCNSLNIADAIGAKLDVGDRLHESICDRLIHLLGGDECNFSVGENYMDTMGEKSNPAETSDASTNHVILDTPLPEDGTSPNDVPTSTITDELRECVRTADRQYDDTPWFEMGEDTEADHTICLVTEGELLRVADGIDEWAKSFEHDIEMWRDRAEDMSMERDELRAKLDAVREALDGQR